MSESSEKRQRIADVFRLLREERRISRHKLADCAGLSLNTLDRIECNRGNIRTGTYWTLLRAIGSLLPFNSDVLGEIAHLTGIDYRALVASVPVASAPVTMQIPPAFEGRD